MYLLDTNVVSITAPTKARSDPELVEWLRANSEALYISVITVSEIMHGIAKAERSGAMLKASRLMEWLIGVENHYRQRLLGFDLDAAHAAGRIADHARAFMPEFQDIAIAAIAQIRGLTVVTFNERHFAPLGVSYLNPLKSALA